MQHTEGWQMNPVKIYLFSRWETRTSSRISKVPSSYSDSFSKHTVQIYIFPSKDKIVMDIISVLLLYLEKQNCSTSHHQQEYFSIPISTQMHHSFLFFFVIRLLHHSFYIITFLLILGFVSNWRPFAWVYDLTWIII